MERFVGSVVRFLRNNPLSSKTVNTSRLFASVKLQQPTIFLKWLRQALHCPSYSTLVTRSLQIHRYWTLFSAQKKHAFDGTNGVSSKSKKNRRVHAQLNVPNKLYPITLRGVFYCVDKTKWRAKYWVHTQNVEILYLTILLWMVQGTMFISFWNMDLCWVTVIWCTQSDGASPDGGDAHQTVR